MQSFQSLHPVCQTSWKSTRRASCIIAFGSLSEIKGSMVPKKKRKGNDVQSRETSHCDYLKRILTSLFLRIKKEKQ
jgi:hypothetical protein